MTKFRLETIPLPPRAIPEWYQRLEIQPRRAYGILFFVCFLFTFGSFGYFTAQQFSFEHLKKRSTVVQGKIIQVNLPKIQYEIFLETETDDLHYLLQETLFRTPQILYPGQRIRVYFIADQPLKSVTEFSVIEYQTFIGISFGFSLFFFFGTWKFWREYFRRKEAYQLGEPLSLSLVAWDEKSGKYRIRLKAPEHFGLQETVCWLPRYVTPVALGSEVLGLHYNGVLAYYWTPEQELTV